MAHHRMGLLGRQAPVCPTGGQLGGKSEERKAGRSTGEGRLRRAVAWLHIACSLASALSRGEAVCEKHKTDTSEG